jgi:phage FluMu protein Com
MAIKRPTKSRGTQSHKPVASAPLRHVDVRAPQQMVPGEAYLGWLCKNRSCGRVIAIAATAQGGKALTDFDDQLTAIKCPHCKDENLYRWSARSEQKYTTKSVET